MKRFKEGKFRVLVATDVASRGLDIPNVDLVIQIEPPKETETYIHRSGRTARAGASGTCITFYTGKTKMLVEQIEQQAGIKLQRIGVPQPEDVIKASAMDICKNLEEVHSDVLPLFVETAQELIRQTGGDAEKALCTALAFISGHYKQALMARSLISGQDRMLTVKLESTNGSRMAVTAVYGILRRFWPPAIADNVRTMRGTRSQAGAVFDLYEDQYARFMDGWAHLQEAEAGRLDFDVAKCTELPELAEDDPLASNGAGWRNAGEDASYGGFGGRGGFRGAYGDRGGRGRGGRGGRGGGYHGDRDYDSRGGGRGGWGSGPSGDSWGGSDAGGGGGWRAGGDRPGFQKQFSADYSGYSRGGGRGYRGNDRGGYGGDMGGNPHSDRGGRGGHSYQKMHSENFSSSHGGASFQARPREVNTVYVGNLNASTDRDALQGAFQSQNLDVRKVNILLNDQGKSKGAGFVTFGSADEAQSVVEQCQRQGLTVDGNRLIVQLARQ